ncbi:MAG: HNH endonuclease [Rhodobacteraceae bacterium]|nr:HNH endonuclease [Paracoccaceae bacterium]
MDRDVYVDFDPPGIRINAEVCGRLAQGKPRLRKREPHNRRKLHLPQLVMAVAALPDPARSDRQAPSFPLENKAFVIDQMDFDVIEDDGIKAVLAPRRVSVRHSTFQVRFHDRLKAVADDAANIEAVREHSPDLADAVEAHAAEIAKGVNFSELRKTADRLIRLKFEIFGQTNAGSAHRLITAEALPEVDAEEISGREGRILTRLHVYRERDRTLVKRAKDHHRAMTDGKLACEVCGKVSVNLYGDAGDRIIEAHHKVPIEELQPDSETTTADLAMVCANCHRVIHSRKPCLTVREVRDIIETV